MLDIILNFNTAYEDNQGLIVVSHKKIIKNYLQTWFLTDFISNIPFENIYSALCNI